MVDRIKQIMEYYKLAPATFAEQIGINRSNLTHLFQGRNQPSLELAKKILLCFPDIKTEWLIMGVGQMFMSSDDRELNIQIQKEKLIQVSQPKPDLFSSTKEEFQNETAFKKSESREIQKEITHLPIPEKPITPIRETSLEIDTPRSHSTVSIKKIIFFYSDNSFEIYQPK